MDMGDMAVMMIRLTIIRIRRRWSRSRAVVALGARMKRKGFEERGKVASLLKMGVSFEKRLLLIK